MKKTEQGTAVIDRTKEDEKFMKRAMNLAKEPGSRKKWGVFGAVIVKDGEIIDEGYNQVIRHNDPTWHGEMQAIREACKKLGSPHLKGAHYIPVRNHAPCVCNGILGSYR